MAHHLAMLCLLGPVLAGAAMPETSCRHPQATESTLQSARVAPANPDSAFLPIHGSIEALQWRLSLADSARHSIDAQYFIWRMDDTGQLLLQRLLDAADRGVKVRLLLDDVLKGGLDTKWIVINTHPNIEVRLFNPFRSRGASWLARGPEWLFNMSRLNHRMHNKLFLVDHDYAIVGGRNIGNEYFGLGSALDFRDFDLLARGPIADRLDRSFEDFWNSSWAYAPETLTEYHPAPGELQQFRQERRRRLAADDRIVATFPTTGLAELLGVAVDRFITAPATVIYDCPPEGASAQPTQVVGALRELLGSTHESIFVVSPYIVLNPALRQRIRELRATGVQITLLTNSLEAADHNITFGAYAKRRRELLRLGVGIHELRGDAEQWSDYRAATSTGSHLSIHAKVIIFDGQKVLISSLNLDPRSKYINTEIGLLIRSKALAGAIREGFARDLAPENSMRVGIDEEDYIYWESSAGRRYQQPARSLSQRLKAFLSRLLPLDHQL